MYSVLVFDKLDIVHYFENIDDEATIEEKTFGKKVYTHKDCDTDVLYRITLCTQLAFGKGRIFGIKYIGMDNEVWFNTIEDVKEYLGVGTM